MDEQAAATLPSLGREAAIRERAHALWQEQGQPEGKEQEHWRQAELEHGERGGDEVPAIGEQPEGHGHASGESVVESQG